MRFFFLFLLIPTLCFARTIEVDGAKYEVSEQYSNKDFTGRKLLDAKDLEGAVIYGSCFSQELTPDMTSQSYVNVFPDSVKTLTIINSNLDNVFIKAGWTVIGGTHRKFRVMNDLRDWELKTDGSIKEVIGKEQWQEQGYSVDAKDIPAQKIADITQIKKAQVVE